MKHLATKFIVLSASLIILGTALIAGLNIRNKIKIVKSEIETTINNKNELIDKLLTSEFTNLNSGLDGALDLLKYETKDLLGEPRIEGTAELDGKTVPQMYFGETGIAGNYAPVDLVKRFHGMTATVFVKDENDDFVRITTNVPSGADPSKRAVNTYLVKETQAYRDLIAGKKYIGIKPIQGRDYMTVYDPIIDPSGEVIGIWYVGVEVTAIGKIRDIVSEERILEEGFFAVSRNGALLAAPGVTPQGDSVSNELIAKYEKDSGINIEKHENEISQATIIAIYPQSAVTGKMMDALWFNIGMLLLNIVLIFFVLRWILMKRIIRPLNEVESVARQLAGGNNNAKLNLTGSIEFESLSNSFNMIGTAVTGMIEEVEHLNEECLAGNLDARGEEEKYSGGYKTVITGFNSTLDKVVKPMQLASERVVDIVEGRKAEEIDIPEYLNNPFVAAVNEMISNNNKLYDEFMVAADAVNKGDTQYRTDAANAPDGVKVFYRGVNKILDAYKKPLEMVVTFADSIGKGTIPECIDDDFEGDFEDLKNNFNHATRAITLLVQTSKGFVEEAVAGNLSNRVDVSGLDGDFRKIAEGFNDALDAIVEPVYKTADYLDRIAKGDIPKAIDRRWNGEFNSVRDNINLLIESLNKLNNMIKGTVEYTARGEFNYRNDLSQLAGDYRTLASGLNDTLDVISDFIDSLPLIIFSTDTKGRITYCNITSRKVSGLECDEIAGRNSYEVFYVGHDDFEGSAIYDSLTEKTTQNGTGKCKPGNNEEIDIEYTISPLFKAGVPVATLSFLNDVTEIQEQARINESINEYMNNEIVNMVELYDAISGGDFSKKYRISAPEPHTQKAFDMLLSIDQAVYKIAKVFTDLEGEIHALSSAFLEGDLNQKADADLFTGNYREIINGLNELMEVVKAPINEAGEVLEDMASGNFTVEMTGSYKGQLNKLKEDINTLAHSLNTALAKVNNTVRDTAAGASEITSSAETIAAASMQMNAQADDVASAVEEMARTVTANAQGASETAGVAGESSDVATEGGRVVQETVQKMNDIAKVVEETARSIEKLGDSSQAIGEIVSVIDDIADQTNLLALNASIEAARAGEQGRGFAVVADEVRKLAEKTVGATKEIAEQITSIQKQTADAVDVMEQGTQEVEIGIKLADKAGKALEKVLASSNQVSQMITDIAAASEEQAATTETISQNVLGISRATGESTLQIGEVAETADNLSRLTDELRNLMSEFQVTEIETTNDEMLLGM